MGLKKLTSQTTPALLAGTGIITAIGALTTFALVLIGLPADVGTTVEGAAPDPRVNTASWTLTPATHVLTEALENPPAGWTKQDGIQKLVTAPLPYSCPQPGAAPSTSLSRAFLAGPSRIQVTAFAYTAGLGAEAMNRQATRAALCAGPDTYLSVSPLTGPGTDARIAATTRSGVRAAVMSYRRGDVIIYVTGSTSDPLPALAKAFDEALTSRLRGVCLALDSGAGDASRNPWSAGGYRPFTQEATARIAAMALPTAAPVVETVPASPAPGLPSNPPVSSSPEPPQVPVPSPDLIKRTVTPKPRPGYPVTPPMPSPVQEPAAPKAPAPEATTEATLQVPAEDTDGPGCGWAFTGMKAPGFDGAAADRIKSAALAEARVKLEGDAKQWQVDVKRYWADYEQYRKDAELYNAYAEKVAEVNKAWSVLAGAWEAYDDAIEDRDAKAAAQTAFLQRQDKARTAWEEAKDRCAAPEPTPSPSASSSPTEEPSASPTASPTPKNVPGCPAERPSILDQAAPEVPPMPAKPAETSR